MTAYLPITQITAYLPIQKGEFTLTHSGRRQLLDKLEDI